MDPDLIVEEIGEVTTTSPYTTFPTNHSFWKNGTENNLNIYYFYDVST